MKMINLTPHEINIIGNKTIKPSGIVARCRVNTKVIDNIDGINITVTEFGRIENLPKSEKGTIFITSFVVARAANRNDIFIPGELVRDKEGKVIGCKNLSKVI